MLRLALSVKPLVHHYRNTEAYFQAPRLRARSFQDLYVGLSPFDAPATFSMLSYTELAHGVWYPNGGMYSIVESLMGLARATGVTFRFNTSVARITASAHRATGVTFADGSGMGRRRARNADLPYVYQRLLPAGRMAKSMLRKDFSCSAISFLWGVDRTYERLGPHTLFLADDYRDNFQTIARDLSLPTNPSVYLHAPARLDPSMAPPGQDTVAAIIPVGHLSDDGEQDWGELRDRARTQVFRR